MKPHISASVIGSCVFALILALQTPSSAQGVSSTYPLHRIDELPGLQRAEKIVQKIIVVDPDIKPGKMKVLKRMVLEADLSEKDVESVEVVERLLSRAQEEVDAFRLKLIWLGVYALFSLVAIMHLLYRVFYYFILEKKT